MTTLSNDYIERDLQHRRKIDKLWQKYPDLHRVEDALYEILTRLTRSVIANPGGRLQPAELTAELEQLRQERRALLQRYKIPDDYNVPSYHCPICKDLEVIETAAGWQLCSCVQKKQLEYQFISAKIPAKMREQRLDNFLLNYYSELEMVDERDSQRRKAEKALQGAEDFVKAVLEQQPVKGLYFFGGAGVGKTHLVSGIANRLMENKIMPLYLMVADLLDELRQGYESSHAETSTNSLMEQAKQAPVLILDDIGAERSTDWSIEKLFQIINHRYLNQLPTVLTSNYDLDELADHMGYGSTGVRICSRIVEMCRLYRLDCEDIRRQKRRESSPPLGS